MGATCWGIRGDYEIPIDTDKNKDEIEIIKTIKEFDWNNKNPYKWTIEEIIMCSIANDTGDLINPQSSHILFSEFKKFMFLNAMYIKEGVKDKTVESKVL